MHSIYYPVGKIAKNKIQCHVVKNTLLQTAFAAILLGTYCTCIVVFLKEFSFGFL